jgi:hypothetical protein
MKASYHTFLVIILILSFLCVYFICWCSVGGVCNDFSSLTEHKNITANGTENDLNRKEVRFKK